MNKRPFFSIVLPTRDRPKLVSKVLKALELIKTKKKKKKKLWDNTSYLRKELTERGFDI